MAKTRREDGMLAAPSSLYVYIYCMLVSNALTDLPIIGGALYMCGKVAQAFFSTTWRTAGERKSAARRWRGGLLALMLVVNFCLVVIYPIAQGVPRMWLIFTVVSTMLLRDGIVQRLGQRAAPEKQHGVSFWGVVTHAVAIMITAVVLLWNLPLQDALFLLGGYVLCSMLNAYTAQKSSACCEETPSEDNLARVEKTNVYKAFSRLSLVTDMALEMTLVVLYTFLAVTAEELLISMLLAVGTTFAFREAAEWFLRRRERLQTSDPTLLMLSGLVLWFSGLLMFSLAMRGDDFRVTYTYLCLGLCSAGTSLCGVCIHRMERVVAAAAEFASGSEAGYQQLRSSGQEMASLLGRMLALITLTVLCFATGKDLPRDLEQIAARFHPVMVVPALILVVLALTNVLNFPLSSRYIQKLTRFLSLRRDGRDNPSLKKQLEAVVVQRHHQPFGTNLLKAMLRPLFRHTLKGTENIQQDDDNPIVFLCNHGEIYGPVSAMLYIPVTVRPWSISEMVVHPKEVAEYLYKWSLSPIKWLGPARWWIARLLGYVSVWGMKQLEAIPVYRNKPRELMTTFRSSVEAMEAGDNLLIFPENPNASENPGYAHGHMGELYRGFPMLAQVYYNKTGKRCRFLPMYAHKGNRTLSFGTPVLYNPDNDPMTERDRIVDEATAQMQALFEREEAIWQQKKK